MAAEDKAGFRDLMQAHHSLGAVPGMGETVRYVAHHRDRWLALLVFSAPALKCRARDRWIGWDYGVRFDRLHLVTNNARFLILPGGPRNLGSRVLSLCTRRLARDWPAASATPATSAGVLREPGPSPGHRLPCRQAATPERLLTLNRGHWTIEANHHILDWSFDEGCSRIRTGHDPDSMTRLRRFAIGLIQARELGVAETMRKLARTPRRVLDFLKMTGNTPRRAAPARPSLGAAPFTRAANPRQTGAVAHVRMPE